MTSDTAKSLSRRQFLRLDYHTTGNTCLPYPPWSRTDAEFSANCTRCSKCIEACPEHILKSGLDSLPVTDFTVGGCTFCAKCVDACPENAFYPAFGEIAPWNHKVSIGLDCFSLNGVVCRTCGDVCEWNAIRFHHEIGGIARPLVNINNCTGCGLCIYACPADAIETKPVTKSDTC